MIEDKKINVVNLIGDSVKRAASLDSFVQEEKTNGDNKKNHKLLLNISDNIHKLALHIEDTTPLLKNIVAKKVPAQVKPLLEKPTQPQDQNLENQPADTTEAKKQPKKEKEKEKDKASPLKQLAGAAALYVAGDILEKITSTNKEVKKASDVVENIEKPVEKQIDEDFELDKAENLPEPKEQEEQKPPPVPTPPPTPPAPAPAPAPAQKVRASGEAEAAQAVPSGQPPSTKMPEAQAVEKPAAAGTAVPEPPADDKPVMEMIKKHEGVRTKPYKDSLGLWTVGVGHLIGDGKTLPPEWNRELSMNEVDTLFTKDYYSHKEAATKMPGYENVNNKAKGALIDLTFNMGNTWFKRWPKFVNAMREGNTEQAANQLEDSKWYDQVKGRAKTIVGLIRQGANPTTGTAIAETSASVNAAKKEQKSSAGTTIINNNTTAVIAGNAPQGGVTMVARPVG